MGVQKYILSTWTDIYKNFYKFSITMGLEDILDNRITQWNNQQN